MNSTDTTPAASAFKKGDIVRSINNKTMIYRILKSGPKRSTVIAINIPGYYKSDCDTSLLRLVEPAPAESASQETEYPGDSRRSLQAFIRHSETGRCEFSTDTKPSDDGKLYSWMYYKGDHFSGWFSEGAAQRIADAINSAAEIARLREERDKFREAGKIALVETQKLREQRDALASVVKQWAPCKDIGEEVRAALAMLEALEMRAKYTKRQLDEFRRLVELGESSNQMDRIESRLKMPKFVAKVGREKCDAMFEVLKKEASK